MLAAGHSKRQDQPTPMVMTQSILPYAWINTYIKYQGGTEPPRGKKTEEEEGENM